MRPSKAWIYVGLGAVAAVGLVELLGGPKVKKGDRVLLVGDDLAQGLSVPLGSLCKEIGSAFQALTTAGTRIADWASSQVLAQTLNAFNPTMVIVCLGTNDAFASSAPSPSVLDQLLRTLHPSAARAVVIVEPPTLPATATTLSSVITLLESQKSQAKIFPSQKLALSRGPDGIHPVASGYAQWAGALWQWIT